MTKGTRLAYEAGCEAAHETKDVIATIQYDAAYVELKLSKERDIYKIALEKIVEHKMNDNRLAIDSYYTLRSIANSALFDGTRLNELPPSSEIYEWLK